ncbi:MAG TPA: hypothetical protein VGO26_08910 [Amnibacterium sp.]|nr:hypothetical protein [Amnibacterium sp.]
MTPARRLLFWLRISFVGDAALAAIGGLLVAEGEAVGIALLIFTALRAAIGVVALVLAARALERRDPHDDRPSVLG